MIATGTQALYDFPQDPREQLERAIRAVFDSWMGDRVAAAQAAIAADCLSGRRVGA